MRITITISVEIDVDGAMPPVEWIEDQAQCAINEAMPSVLADSDEQDCILFVRAWETKAKADA